MVKTFLYRVISGFFLGISFVAPGFSGSMMAIAMGIYKDLLRIVSNPFKPFKDNLRFATPIGIGMIISAVLIVLAFNHLFETHEKAINILFVGLIAGYLPVIFKEVKEVGFEKKYLVGGIVAFAVAIGFGVFAFAIMPETGAQISMDSLLILVLSGFVSGAIMLVPGMSVSTVLILFGVYTPLVAAAREMMGMEFSYLLPFGLFFVAFLVGLALASKLIKKAFEKYPGYANTAVLGFVFGSLISILYQSLQIEDAGFNWLIGGAMLVVGFGLSMLFVVMGKTMNRDQGLEDRE